MYVSAHVCERDRGIKKSDMKLSISFTLCGFFFLFLILDKHFKKVITDLDIDKHFKKVITDLDIDKHLKKVITDLDIGKHFKNVITDLDIDKHPIPLLFSTACHCRMEGMFHSLCHL